MCSCSREQMRADFQALSEAIRMTNRTYHHFEARRHVFVFWRGPMRLRVSPEAGTCQTADETSKRCGPRRPRTSLTALSPECITRTVGSLTWICAEYRFHARLLRQIARPALVCCLRRMRLVRVVLLSVRPRPLIPPVASRRIEFNRAAESSPRPCFHTVELSSEQFRNSQRTF